MLLSVEDLHAGYGKRQVLREVYLRVEEKGVTNIFGHNGAGKSTTLKSIISIIKPWRGKIFFKEADITGHEPWHNVQQGISYCPEANPVFGSLTVKENLLLAGRIIKKVDGKQYLDCLERVYGLFPKLNEKGKVLAGSLSGGERQMLALGVSLMNAPKLVLLDEPSAGLSPLLVTRLFSAIKEMKDKLGVGILLVEQNIEDAAKLADLIYVLHQGRITFGGNKQEWDRFVQKDKEGPKGS
jgi:branched-chain amino acid transport system ATP-binding protein